jgi:hypothetical protein
MRYLAHLFRHSLSQMVWTDCLPSSKILLFGGSLILSVAFFFE